MRNGVKNYDDPIQQAAIAKFPRAALGFYRKWNGDVGGDKIGAAVRAIKALSPATLIGQYTILNEAANNTATNQASSDIAIKINAADWWLRDAAGAIAQYTTAYGKYDLNITEWSPADADGLRYPQWLARRDYAQFFATVPEFDFVYSDNCIDPYRGGPADWMRDGTDRAADDPVILTAWRRGMAAHWAEIRRLNPTLAHAGNTDSDMSQPEFTGKLDWAFIEGAIGKSYSTEASRGWAGMMQRYRDTDANCTSPGGAILHAFGASATDHQAMRYGLASALQGDGMYAYNSSIEGYSSLPWCESFDARLGEPVAAAHLVGGVSLREYEGGLAVVNATKPADKTLMGSTVTVDLSAYQLRRILGAEPGHDGAPVGVLTLQPREGAILLNV